MAKPWYQDGVVYQIYPRSFNDANGDGIGDIRGIIEKIGYLQSLGVSMVWLSPIYQSPNDDNGYDISDYYQIQPELGSMADFDEMVAKLHDANIKLVMDLVINHTSDEHEWFKKSVENDPVYKDFYHWKSKKGNWGSFFGGDAWEYNPKRDAYYLHLFSKKQPDLNWSNPVVRSELKKMIRFWLDKGVDGFRCDVINIIAKEEGDPDGKWALFLRGREHYLNHPAIHEYLQELRKDVFDYYDCFTVGETVFANVEMAKVYQDEHHKELDMMFQFDHMNADNFLIKWFPRKFKPIRLKRALSKWQNGLNGFGWNTLYLENHDQPRSLSRFGHPDYEILSAKLLATIIYFQQGTPFIYQGQEIGMTNAHFTDLDDYRDIESKRIYRFMRDKLHYSHQKAMKRLSVASRDHARTPMQWSDKENAGFTKGTPWIKVNERYLSVNVEQALEDPTSILHYYQEIIHLRKMYPIIVEGTYRDLHAHHRRLYCYERSYQNASLIVVANMSSRPIKVPQDLGLCNYKVILANTTSEEPLLQPYEARVYYKP